MADRPNTLETLIRDYVEGKPEPLFDLELDGPEVERIAAEAGHPDPDLYSALKRLRRKKYFHRLQNGTYVVRSEPADSARLWSLDQVAEAVLRRLDRDYYISWHAALWHYNLIDQQSRRVSVAVPAGKWKRPVVIGQSRLEFVRLGVKKFFDSPVSVGDDVEWPVMMSTPARAIIDSFDRPDLVGPPPVIVEALRRGWRDQTFTSPELVNETLKLESPTLNRRIGFFMDLLEIPGSDELAFHLGRGYAEPLFPGREPRGKAPVDQRWRVYLDVGIINTALELK